MPQTPVDRSRMSKSVSAALQLVLPLFGNPREREIARPAPTAPRKPATPPRELAKGETNRQIWLGKRRLEYIFKRRPRKSIGFTIDRRGLVVSAPRWVTISAVEQAIQEKESWIGSKLSEWQSFEARLAELRTEWGEGGRLRYLGKTLVIRLDEECLDPHLDMTAIPWQLHVPLAATAEPDQVRRAVDHWLKLRAQELLAHRIEFYAQRLGQHPSAWRLSSAKTLWGTCTQDGLIRLNWRLIHLSSELIDYVVAHELAHLKELNHSAEFWRTVGQIMPEYEKAKSRLGQIPEHLAL
ncbi:MAG: M48 family metallopeptidase [Burkholderiaceae bacterium]